jgi:hypothetical protein
MEVQEFLRGLFQPVDDNFFEHRTQNPLFEFHRRGGMLPQQREIASQHY